MKKILRFLVLSTFCLLVLTGVSFGALTMYYRNNFPVNTWVNGVYCTGKTVEEVNKELIEIQEASVVTITDANRAYWEIDMQTAGIEPDYSISLRKYLISNSKIFWTKWLQKGSDIQIQADSYTFNEEKLLASLENLAFVVEERQKQVGVELRCEEDVYYLYDGNANRLDVEKVYESLVQVLENGETELYLADIECYRDLEDNDADEAQRELWNKIITFADCKLLYDMGAEQIEITPEMAIGFLKRENDATGLKSGTFAMDGQGNLIVDEMAVNVWVDALLEQYNTCDTTRKFQSTRGDIVEVTYVKYGTEINGDAEKAYLYNALSQTRTDVEIHVPTYVQEGYVRGLDDIGGTYIEIDMTEQKMYYYEDGVLTLETEVVTGDVRDDMETPEGINYVYNKQRNRTLRGPGYASFVKYWMPVIGGVGIHDASWRSKFGGEIYKKNGSHGCINTPSDIMDEFYDATEIGMPVIMFY